ncbi:MAG: N-acetylmuramoyl-L-alanine amidase [Lachnospiraceae bacterium]|nr:N-acetylmuramoyl-L-alanine amidase [Lachnospiraceae bacterium]
MRIGVNCGHTIGGSGYGAVGLIKESEHTRQVGYALMEKLLSEGIAVTDCTVNQGISNLAHLEKIVDLANKEELDWFVSIHFNASKEHKGRGVEIFTYQGKRHQPAVKIGENIEKLGFKNRGIKNGSHLYTIKNTKAKAMLIEVCFCDNKEDVELYQKVGVEAITTAIAEGLLEFSESLDMVKDAKKELPFEDFVRFVGEVAIKDWKERRIMLPSVVVAQAIKESASGTSELARNANALFGIKKNGWTGKVYTKTATEQRPDGSYYVVDHTEWRAYNSWEESILDHNDYIATRSTDGGKTLRYQPVIGCENYVLCCQYLKQCGYATALNYDESLINDYIEKYKLYVFDEGGEWCLE